MLEHLDDHQQQMSQVTACPSFRGAAAINPNTPYIKKKPTSIIVRVQ